MICQVTIVFIRHLFNKDIKKQVLGAKDIQTLRHAITLAVEEEIKLYKYDGLNDDDPSVMKVNAIPHSEVIAVRGKVTCPKNNPDNNQVLNMSAPRLN